MSKETTTRLIDDLDGDAADRTVSFSWGGRSYEIDLNQKNGTAFEQAITPYVAAARITTSGRPRRNSRRPAGRATRKATGRTSPRVDLGPVREWARANGHPVSDRGRISAAVLTAYEAAIT